METGVKQGYLLLADISGFSTFVNQTEIDHGASILRNLIDTILSNFEHVMRFVEVEGDAIFVYVNESEIHRGELILELIEATYVSFRGRQRTMVHNADCPCRACRSIPNLDLKFITHFGEYVLQTFVGREKPVGQSVNAVHRLLKNSVKENFDWRGYALFTEAALNKMRISPAGMREGVESYPDAGDIHVGVLNLEKRFAELSQGNDTALTPRTADLTVSYQFPAPPQVVWDWLTDPKKRNLWMDGSNIIEKKRPLGRAGPAAQNHCTTKRVIEDVLDWHPIEHFTVKMRKSFIAMKVTYHLSPEGDKTRVSWVMKLEGPYPRWIRRKICAYMCERKVRLRESFERLNEMITPSV